MKIAPSIKNPIVNTVPTARGGSGVSSISSQGSNKGAVDLSSTARHLSSLQNSDSDINVERVQAIRDAIAAGQLKVDPSRIADSLIASVRELLK